MDLLQEDPVLLRSASMPQGTDTDQEEIAPLRSSSLSAEPRQQQRNSVRDTTKKPPVISTPFTSSRYRHHSVHTRPYNVGSPRSTSQRSSIASRLAEVKRLVEAGFVKQAVYDKLVGANTLSKDQHQDTVFNTATTGDTATAIPTT